MSIGPNRAKHWGNDGPSWGPHADRGHPKAGNTDLAMTMVRAAQAGKPMPIPPIQGWVIDDIKFMGEMWAALARKQASRSRWPAYAPRSPLPAARSDDTDAR